MLRPSGHLWACVANQISLSACAILNEHIDFNEGRLHQKFSALCDNAPVEINEFDYSGAVSCLAGRMALMRDAFAPRGIFDKANICRRLVGDFVCDEDADVK